MADRVNRIDFWTVAGLRARTAACLDGLTGRKGKAVFYLDGLDTGFCGDIFIGMQSHSIQSHSTCMHTCTHGTYIDRYICSSPHTYMHVRTCVCTYVRSKPYSND